MIVFGGFFGVPSFTFTLGFDTMLVIRVGMDISMSQIFILDKLDPTG